MKLLLATIISLVATSALAAGPCKTEREACQAKGLKPGSGLWKCVAEAAAKDSNEACTQMLAKHHPKAEAAAAKPAAN